MAEVFKNKVAESGILTIDLSDYYPKEDVMVFDIKDYLFMGLILKEKDFRAALKTLDTVIYQDKLVTVTCSADAIIPVWAYMLVTTMLQPIARDIIFADERSAKQLFLLRNIGKINATDFADSRVVIKGCGDIQIPEEAYVQISTMLRPVVKSIMYGEPCSTVPVYKKEKPGLIQANAAL